VDRPEFDVFLSHSSADTPAVEVLARRLRRRRISLWLDVWRLSAGAPWQQAIEDALARSASCAVFIGPGGAGPWQEPEIRAAIDRRVSAGAGGDSFRVIPVLLPGAVLSEGGGLPAFLRQCTWVDFRGQLDDKEALRRLVCGIRGVEPGPEAAEAVCPYRGLEVFDVGDADLFYGRKALVDELLERLRPGRPGEPGAAAPAPRYGGAGAERFLAIIGPSGSGKSSLARAGLVSRLQDEGWPTAICRPGAQPLANLAVALAARWQRSSTAVPDLERALAADPRMLHFTAMLPPGGDVAAESPGPPATGGVGGVAGTRGVGGGGRSRRAQGSRSGTGSGRTGAAGAGGRLVVLVDQFEELFTQCADEAQRRALIDNLLYAATVAGGRTVVLLTLRADFYGRCAAYRELASALDEGRQKLVNPMSAEELRQAIEEPARSTKCELEPGLVELLLADVKGQPGYLPLLQDALFQLWEQRRGNRLTVEAYGQIGGMDGALGRRADRVFEGLPTESQQQVCRQVMLRLVQPVPGADDARLRVALDELLPAAELAEAGAGEVETVVQVLARERLLTIGTAGMEEEGRRPFVELAHEALIAGWPRLRGWIEDGRKVLLLRRRLDEAASQWEAGGRDASYLYRGANLVEAEEWAEPRRGEVNRLEDAFLAASTALHQDENRRELEQADRLREEQRLRADAEHRRAEAERERAEEQRRRADEEHRTARRLRRRAVTLAVLLVVAAGLAAWAWRVQREANESRREAIARRLLNQIPALRESDPTLGLLLSFALRRAPWAGEFHADAAAALRRSLALSGGRPAGDEAVVLAIGGPGQRFLATGGADGAVRVWDMLAAEPMSRPWLALSLSAPPGSPAPPASPQPQGAVAALALDPRGRWLVAAVKDGAASLLHLPPGDKGGEAALRLSGEDWVFAGPPPFSPDGRWLATMRNGEPVLRDLDAPRSAAAAPVPLRAPSPVPSPLSLSTPMVFSPDGPDGRCRWLALGGRGGTVMIWDLQADSPATAGLVLPGRAGEVAALTFSRDGTRLAASGRGGPASVRVWTLPAGSGGRRREAPQTYGGCEGLLLNVSFSPDGGKLLGQTGTASCVWRSSGAEPPTRPVLLPAAFEAAFSPDGRSLALARRDGGVTLWDLETSQASTDRRLQDVSVRTVAFSPLGRWLTLGGDGESAVLVDRGRTDRPAIPLHGHRRPIQRVGFAAGERWLVVQGTDEAPRLWDLRHGDPVADAEPAVWPYPAATDFRALGQDGRFLAATERNGGRVRIWDSALGAGFSPSLAACPDDAQGPWALGAGGRWLAGGRRGGRLYLWPLRGLVAPAPRLLADPAGQVTALAFSQDESWLAAGDGRGDSVFWPLANLGAAATPLPVRDAGGVSTLAFSPNGRWLATADSPSGHAAVIHLWDWERKRPPWAPRSLEQHHAKVRALAFDAGGRWLASGGMDRRIVLWDLARVKGEPPHETLSTEPGEVLALAFGSPDGPDPRWLAAVESGGIVKLWALAGSPPRVSAGVVLERGRGLGGVPSLAFSADGRYLWAADLDGSVWRFDLDGDRLEKLACARAGRSLTQQEWERYFDQEAYQPTCPPPPGGSSR